MDDKIKIYEQGRLTFELRPKLTLVFTPLQGFYLSPRKVHCVAKIHFIRTLIELGQVKHLEQLASLCGNDVQWVATHVQRAPIQECEVITPVTRSNLSIV